VQEESADSSLVKKIRDLRKGLIGVGPGHDRAKRLVVKRTGDLVRIEEES